MSYLVLARKSRPQTFLQVVGQRPIVKTLQNSLLRERVAHAILFSGVRGVGKTTLARIMAKALNCLAELANRPCNECDSCREITRGSSLDIHEIDGASNRGIQEIRELKEKIRFLPTSARYKIIIIDEVHMLTSEAFNALLKTLEEPPAHVHFMFATTEIHKIPITILSRCQQYELKRISATELYNHFYQLTKAEGYDIEPAALSLIVREAAGSVRDGLSLLDQMFSFGEKTITNRDVVEILGLVNRDVLLRLTRALLDGEKSEVFLTLDEIFNYGMDIKRFLEDLMDHFRTLLLCKIDGCNNIIDLPSEELADFFEMSKAYTHETLHQKLSLLMSVAEELKLSAQPRLTLETAFLKIVEAGNIVAVSSLLGRLEEILAGVSVPQHRPPLANEESDLVEQKKKLSFLTERTSPDNQHVNAVDDDPPISTTEKSPAEPGPLKPSLNTERESAQEATSKPEIEDKPAPGQPVELHPHEKDVRKNWLEFIAYVKDRKLWMAQDLQRADAIKQETAGELHLTYEDHANCSLLRQKENHQLLTEFALDFFQKPLKVKFIIPHANETATANGTDTPHRKRQQLANDPLVVMAAEVFNGQVGDIRIGPRSR
jgi:DNA polymerase-3 subunit gamma/tau